MPTADPLTPQERAELHLLLDRARVGPGTDLDWRRIQILAEKLGWKVEPAK